MQSNRIEQKIDDIYGFVESCKMQRLSTTKVIVPKDELYDLLDDLRRDVPEEIKRYQKILRQKNAILEDAEDKAAAILSDAQEQYKALVEEHAIMQEAKQQAELTVREATAQAEQIIANATAQAEEIGLGAINYTKEMLETAGKIISNASVSASDNARALDAALQGHLDIIRQNIEELVQDGEPEQEEYPEQRAQEQTAAYQENMPDGRKQ